MSLKLPETKLASGPLTVEEASLMVSFICVGGLLGNISFLWIVANFGRKKPLHYLAIVQIVSQLSADDQNTIDLKWYFCFFLLIFDGIMRADCLVTSDFC